VNGPPQVERVVLVSRDAMLAEALETLVEAPGEVSMVDWRADGLELALQHADAVVVDVPPNLHERTFAVIDGRFLGRLVVLLQEGEPADALPPGPSRVVLYRPLQIGDLWAAVTGAAEAAGPEPDAAGTRTPAPMIGMSGRELEPVIGPGQVAPGMDADTLEQLRRWRARGERDGGERMFSQTMRKFGDDMRCGRRDEKQVCPIGELDVTGPPIFLLIVEACCHRIF
jgi:hypothetical protein